jgi:hypothetical protein
MGQRSRNTILIPADKRPPANRDGWKRHAAIVRLTIESRNTQEHKLQNCNNQNAAKQNVDKNAIDKNAARYNAMEHREVQGRIDGSLF